MTTDIQHTDRTSAETMDTLPVGAPAETMDTPPVDTPPMDTPLMETPVDDLALGR